MTREFCKSQYNVLINPIISNQQYKVTIIFNCRVMNFNPNNIIINPKKLVIKSKNVKPHRNCSTFAIKFLKTEKIQKFKN